MIWLKKMAENDLNKLCKNSAVNAMGIIITKVGDNFLEGTMPVNNNTVQPFNILHGGSSCLLAESLGSLAAHMCVDQEKYFPIGLDINANHIKSAKLGELVTGIARPIHLGRSTQIWEIKISNEKNQLICISRLTMSIISKNIDVV